MKRNVFVLFLAMVLILIAFVPAPEAVIPIPVTENAVPVEASLPEEPVPVPKPEKEIKPFIAPPKEPMNTELPDGLFIFDDMSKTEIASSGYQAALYNGKLIMRGRFGYVTDYATGESIGFSSEVFTAAPVGDDSDYYSAEDVPSHFELYHADGSYWCECGNFSVWGVLGDYFIGRNVDYDNKNWWNVMYYTKDPSDPASYRIAPALYCLGNDRCLIENNNGSDFLGIEGVAVVNSALERLGELEIPKGDYSIILAGQDKNQKVCYLDADVNDYIIDLYTMKQTPYVKSESLRESLDRKWSYCLCRENGKYDLLDWNGDVVLTDCESEIMEYNGTFVRLSNGCIYTLCEGRLKRRFSVSDSSQAFLYGDYVYVNDNSQNEVTCYDARFNACARFPAKDLNDYYSYGALNYTNGDEMTIILKGGPYAIKSEWDGQIYNLENRSHPDVEACYCCYDTGDDYTQALVNDRGETVADGFTYICRTGEPHIYSVLKGDRWGLIDGNGNWLFTQFTAED